MIFGTISPVPQGTKTIISDFHNFGVTYGVIGPQKVQKRAQIALLAVILRVIETNQKVMILGGVPQRTLLVTSAVPPGTQIFCDVIAL